MRIPTFFFILLVASGCAHTQQANTQIIRTGAVPDYWTEPGTIDIFTSREEIKKPFRETAIVVFDSGGHNFSEAAIIEYLRERSGEVGADAILLMGGETTSLGGTYNGWTNSYNQVNRQIVRARAITYLESERTPAAKH